MAKSTATAARPEVRLSKTMKVLDLKLGGNGDGAKLREFLAERTQARSGERSLVPGTGWDDVAFDLRTATGERVVRETAQNFAERFGLVPTREQRRAAREAQESAGE